MAQTVAALTENIRVALADSEDHRFSDANILVFLNKAYRKIHGVFTHNRPELIKTVASGTTVAGTADIKLSSGSFQRILSLHVDELEIKDIGQEPSGAYESTDYGFPKGFYISAWDTVTLVPKPDDAYAYRLAYVARPTALTSGASTTWPDDFDDLMEEFTVMRLGIIDEGDPSAEAQFLQDIEMRAKVLLGDLAPHPGFIQSYWSVPTVRSAY
jgi:hypothetical protein